jgi:hypothetical protein
MLKFFFLILGCILVFFLIQKNPEKEDFIRESIKQYSLTKLGMNRAEANGTAEISTSLIGEYIEPFIERKDFVLFSTYDVYYRNENIKMTVKAFGLWDHIIFYEGSVKKLNPSPSTLDDYAKD